MSLISTYTTETLELFMRVRLMKGFGASLYGGDLSKWPAKLVDAFTMLEGERSQVESLMRVRPKGPGPQQKPTGGGRRR